jgi:hypothetical protein
MLKISMNAMALPKTRSANASLRCSGVRAEPSAISSDMRISFFPISRFSARSGHNPFHRKDMMPPGQAPYQRPRNPLLGTS